MNEGLLPKTLERADEVALELGGRRPARDLVKVCLFGKSRIEEGIGTVGLAGPDCAQSQKISLAKAIGGSPSGRTSAVCILRLSRRGATKE